MIKNKKTFIKIDDERLLNLEQIFSIYIHRPLNCLCFEGQNYGVDMTCGKEKAHYNFNKIVEEFECEFSKDLYKGNFLPIETLEQYNIEEISWNKASQLSIKKAEKKIRDNVFFDKTNKDHIDKIKHLYEERKKYWSDPTHMENYAEYARFYLNLDITF